MKRVILITGLMVLILVSSVSAFIANDPTSQIQNARVIALGKAYVGLGDDAAAAYSNPAGIANIEKLQVSSMFGRFMEDYSYTSINGVYPTKYGVFGLGYAGSGIEGAPVTRIKPGTESDPVYEVDSAAGTMGNTNNVLLLSYGSDLNRSDVSVGANLKLFSTNLIGGGISDGNGSGMDLDLGVQARPRDFLKLGIVGRNILPASLGGKLAYPGGHDESFPASLVYGASFKVLGDRGLREFKGQELIVACDINSSVSQKNPSTLHLGIEYSPIPLIALRVGLDQNNLTGGIGLNVKGFRFDYAYHQFEAAPGMSNNYFSISYGLPVAEARKELVEPAKPLELIRFKDVPENHWAYNQISLLATQGIIKGYPDGNFRPEGKINRSEIATVLVRTADVKVQKGKHLFSDVSPKSWAYDQIFTAASVGYVNGYPDARFKPQKGITRAEAVTTVSKFANVVPVKYNKEYKDIKPSHWAAGYVAGAKTAGMLQYVTSDKLSPNSWITRAEAVEILYRTQTVQDVLAKGILKGQKTAVAVKK
ncbi:hypothetical protein A2276_05780 [candidate division WOR-1 bacterium RIFOXYA12_FULL_43_27]|uniref:SLH domain-containing protein n=1 Tax=candidate division WOR-1 bacterium RIFOXYC2_FULL_46_14 TaxID=1802587 RepID=A0A1F4U3M0_UNCSA|nr:MAG: hypothetical protein A2276_05780 [candidate division WOR-1 bacterium RIFOXYA12_FULL_43_27]OGC20173.1 MAG: hypothetical protein A2292_03780 [candidate division WOR-1 bacterium RIFOXYB2_FULL_46_45]OGC32090.1 MAG: hypothetical protein A2232_07670 [candidate division WOR-1 bacterium RIFOXYA2_FULL_46_56]OGC39491.1 MAG: hypothetical protein A2438_08030 [candidate division WOR-1 bacterium RIFOXYC2_FULL_46_14]